MQWTILGAGAIGSLLATQLQSSGESVNLLDLRHTPHPASAGMAIELKRRDGSLCFCELPLCTLQQLSHSDVLLVTTKVWQVIPALTPLQDQLPPQCAIILLHNGMGTTEWLLEHFPDNPLLAGVTSCGALKTDPHHVEHTGFGETWLGALNQAGESYQHLIPIFEKALGHAGWSGSIAERQWIKLAINAVINPMTAVLNQRSGILLQHKQEIAGLCAELAPLLNMHGVDKTADELQSIVLQVVECTAQNYSSMQQDLAHHRKTEVDYITGYLLQQAEKQGIDLPQHRELYQQVKALESQFI